MPKNKFDFDFDFDWGSLGDIPDWDLPIETPGDWGPPPEWGAPDPVTPGDWGITDPGMGDGAGGSNWSSLIGQIGRLFGSGGSGSGGSLGGLGSLLPLLALGGGALFQNRNTGQATDQMLAANQRAEDLVTGRMNAPSPFLPYTDQGREGVWNMQAMGPRALAGNYKPLGSGRALKK